MYNIIIFKTYEKNIKIIYKNYFYLKIGGIYYLFKINLFTAVLSLIEID